MPVEQLHKLDNEFNIADAAVTGFDIGPFLALGDGPIFDFSLERFDAADIGSRQRDSENPSLQFFQ